MEPMRKYRLHIVSLFVNLRGNFVVILPGVATESHRAVAVCKNYSDFMEFANLTSSGL